jgi:hypothetical protein
MRKRVSRGTFRQVIHTGFADKFFGFLVATESVFSGAGENKCGRVGEKHYMGGFPEENSSKRDECVPGLDLKGGFFGVR